MLSSQEKNYIWPPNTLFMSLVVFVLVKVAVAPHPLSISKFFFQVPTLSNKLQPKIKNSVISVFFLNPLPTPLLSLSLSLSIRIGGANK